ncbi:splicing regulator RBM11 [Peromyscus californicus insignis]|uniref:splicing regulator RBM11 n=1 Tax=Peromyscus californicus insignis TaxID=564181 RepID=UPI0022A7FE22|nr:splicing regulator RBM11 [Peromyscus californicus insignis]
MFPAQEEADRTVFVGNLEARVREEILYELFLQAGPLTKVTLCKDRDGKPKSFGFVCFKHPESVSYAIALLNGIRLYGRPINVQYRFGSSRSSEPASQSFESCVKIHSHSFRNDEMLGRSSFPMHFFPIANAALPQEYFFFQKTHWHTHSPMLQPPFYDMTASLPNSASGSRSLNLEAGPSSYEWTHQQPSDPDLYQRNKRKRERQASDTDSSSEDKRGNEGSQKHQKCKRKKKYQ